ncbi:MAG: hypothetical protein WDK95_17615 [Syntrophorhabdaceae bacterium]
MSTLGIIQKLLNAIFSGYWWWLVKRIFPLASSAWATPSMSI